MIKDLKNQYQKNISNVNLSYKSLKELRKINRLMFSIFIQLKMKHDYFKSYLHRLSENNSNKCYEICNARQTLKHLLLNCRHYKAEQIKLKKKAQLKNTDTILTLFIIKIERIATLKYLKNTWIATRKWLLKIDNKIYLYKMLTMNLLQAMLVRRAEQSHQHQQSSNSALVTCWAYTQSKSETITMQSSTHWSSHIHRRTATSLHTCCNSYTTYIYILWRHNSAFAHIQTDVMQ